MADREVWVQELDGAPLCVYIKGQHIAGDAVVRYVPESAKAEAQPAGLDVIVLLQWLEQRGHKHAATDLDCNWNDPGQPGDGSCLTLREQAAKPRTEAQPAGTEAYERFMIQFATWLENQSRRSTHHIRETYIDVANQFEHMARTVRHPPEPRK